MKWHFLQVSCSVGLPIISGMCFASVNFLCNACFVFCYLVHMCFFSSSHHQVGFCSFFDLFCPAPVTCINILTEGSISWSFDLFLGASCGLELLVKMPFWICLFQPSTRSVLKCVWQSVYPHLWFVIKQASIRAMLGQHLDQGSNAAPSVSMLLPLYLLSTLEIGPRRPWIWLSGVATLWRIGACKC